MRDEQEAREQDEVGDDARPAVADERERDPGQRDDPQDAADDDERLQREAEREPEREQLREAVLCEHRHPEPAQAEEHVDEQQCGRADEPELLGERGVDEVRVELRDQRVAARRRVHALPEALAVEASVPDRVQRLDDLVPGRMAVLPRVDPDRDPFLHPRHEVVEEGRAADEQREAGGGVPAARSGDVEHREEDPVVEERASEVVRHDDDEHGGAPDRKQRPEVLQSSLCEHLPLLAQVAGQEDDQHDLRELAGLELDPTHVHPEARSVDLLADHRERGQEQEGDGGEPEQVLVALEAPVVVPQEEERCGERGDADDDPEPLSECVVRVQPVDLRHADRGQERGHRQQVRVGLRDGDARDDVRGEIKGEEEQRVRERAGGDDVLARDVDACEADRSEQGDDEKVDELAVPVAEREHHWLWPYSQYTSTRSAATTASAMIMRAACAPKFGCGSGSSSATASGCDTPSAGIDAAIDRASSGGTTIVSITGTRSTSVSVSSSSFGGAARSSAGIGSVLLGASAPSATTSKKTTVMLSSPPLRLAAATSSLAASSRLSRRGSTTSRISSSPTIEVSPSGQMGNRSPGLASTENVSTSTSGSVPSARVMTERCGCDSASSGESRPLRTSSATSEWSSVSWSTLRSRIRYARESPTWPIETIPFSNSATVIVVPMPEASESSRARS